MIPNESPLEKENPYAAPGADLRAESNLVELVLAKRRTRFLAKIFDGFGNSLSLAPLGICVFLLLPGHESYLFAAVFGIGGLFAVYKWIRYNLRMMSTNGQTFGKIAVGIKVVRTDGSPLTLGRWITHRALAIALICAIPYVGFVVSLANYLAIFRESRQCLHDQIADTIVVKA